MATRDPYAGLYVAKVRLTDPTVERLRRVLVRARHEPVSEDNMLLAIHKLLSYWDAGHTKEETGNGN